MTIDISIIIADIIEYLEMEGYISKIKPKL